MGFFFKVFFLIVFFSGEYCFKLLNINYDYCFYWWKVSEGGIDRRCRGSGCWLGVDYYFFIVRIVSFEGGF